MINTDSCTETVLYFLLLTAKQLLPSCRSASFNGKQNRVGDANSRFRSVSVAFVFVTPQFYVSRCWYCDVEREGMERAEQMVWKKRWGLWSSCRSPSEIILLYCLFMLASEWTTADLGLTACEQNTVRYFKLAVWILSAASWQGETTRWQILKRNRACADGSDCSAVSSRLGPHKVSAPWTCCIFGNISSDDRK